MDNPLVIHRSRAEDLTEQMVSFGEYIAARRKALKLTLKDLAAQLKKSDGVPISLAYLHDIETGSRKPPNDQLIDQLATLLGIPVEILYYQAERMPSDLIRDDVSEERVMAAYQAFRREINLEGEKKKKRK
jgi:transcriptional regulator with XRE-family HTH domain